MKKFYSIERIEKELAKIAEVLANWPMLTDSLEKAKALQVEKGLSQILCKHRNAVQNRAKII